MVRRSFHDRYRFHNAKRPTGRAGALPHPALERMNWVATLLDDAVRIPLIGMRVGLDPVLNLIPVAGSALGVALSIYFLWEASHLRLPAHVYARMLLNIAVDAGLGAIPFAGIFGDVLWKANRRNVKLVMHEARKAGYGGS